MKYLVFISTLLCLAIGISSFTTPGTTGKKAHGQTPVHPKRLKVTGTVTINLNNSTGGSLPTSGVFLKQGGVVVRTLYFPTTGSGVNSYSDIPAGTYDIQGYFPGSIVTNYRCFIPQKGPNCGLPDKDFGSYTLIEGDVLSVVCMTASDASNTPFCPGN